MFERYLHGDGCLRRVAVYITTLAMLQKSDNMANTAINRGVTSYDPLSLGSQIQYLASAPASTRKSKPVIISASSEARKAAALP
jgi:hypothetical protein